MTQNPEEIVVDFFDHKTIDSNETASQKRPLSQATLDETAEEVKPKPKPKRASRKKIS